ncbi:acyltransferase [Sphingorhabdus sp. YGSMI21]|uniref:acyltransferase n=1 Tax=Sphingorhabdus sp. YGSMI21 TaxID=2077182 RepID=UPI000C1F1545|nr:acyltransferase [Sphingorhabdus sp. YGSMI21]ATW03117.1 hypothetical protein CHN51_05840 [Sphingorhabdus sp. YGSMI21]
MGGRIYAYFKRWGVIEGLGRPIGILHNKLHTRIYSFLFGIEIGPGAIIEPGAILRRGPHGRIVIGANSLIHSGAQILAHGGSVTMGHQCSVNPNSILYGHGGLTIGNKVLIAAGTNVIPANHATHASQPVRGQGLVLKGITIEDDVWLGTGATVLDGSHIEVGAVIAAGAVVTGIRVDRYSIFGGIPAKKIGQREGFPDTLDRSADEARVMREPLIDRVQRKPNADSE